LPNRRLLLSERITSTAKAIDQEKDEAEASDRPFRAKKRGGGFYYPLVPKKLNPSATASETLRMHQASDHT